MRRIAFLWPYPPDAATAAAVRLKGFLGAADRLQVPAFAVVPYRRGNRGGNESGVVRLRLYDTYAEGGGSFAALAALVWSTLYLVWVLRSRECRCIVASTPAPFVPLQGIIAAKLMAIPFVLDLRDTWEMEATTHEGRIRNRMKGWIEKVCAASADTILCVTSTLRNRIIAKYGLPPARVQIVTNGADLTLFRPGSELRDIDFIFLGSPAKYRNTDAVLEGLARVVASGWPVTACFVGWEGGPEGEHSQAVAATKGLLESVRFVRPVRHEQTPRLLRRARLGIVSLSNEDVFRAAIGAKTYEYIACGIPLACLGPDGRSELREFVESESIGFYASSPEEFAACAVALLSNEKKWANLSRNCVAASGRFDRRAISETALRELVLPLLIRQAGNREDEALP